MARARPYGRSGSVSPAWPTQDPGAGGRDQRVRDWLLRLLLVEVACQHSWLSARMDIGPPPMGGSPSFTRRVTEMMTRFRRARRRWHQQGRAKEDL
jgi:hypothetical protein